MRVLICLLFTLLFTVPVLADDWDGDRVVRKRPKKDKASDEQQHTEESEDGGEPLGMYFGNGDEFLESGAPQDEEEAPEAEESADAEESEAAVDESIEKRSAILGPRHKPPVFFDQPAPEPDHEPEPETTIELKEESVPVASVDDEIDVEVAEPAEVPAGADELDTVVVEAVETVNESVSLADEEISVEEVSSELAETEAISETMVETEIESVEAETEHEASETVDVEEIDPRSHGWEDGGAPQPDSGLAHYSSYPAMQGVGTPKHELEESVEESDEHEYHHDDDHDDEHDESAKPKRLKAYDPDEW
ncbi:MAG: hypothetical protein M3R04_10145 [bacterium]|nr:hypothetical protein [bacterium]